MARASRTAAERRSARALVLVRLAAWPMVVALAAWPMVVALAAWLAGAAPRTDAAESAATDDERPNVLVLIVDDLSDSDVDRLRTPALDELCKGATRFRRAYAHAWCAPSRDSFLFSSWDGQHRGEDCAEDRSRARPADAPTIAETFRAAGYRTAHFGKWHLGPAPEGDWRDAPRLRGYDEVRFAALIGDDCPAEGLLLNEGELVEKPDAPTTVLLQRAVEAFWRRTEGPKFAVVNFDAGHAPFHAPPVKHSYRFMRFPTPKPHTRQAWEAEIVAVDRTLAELRKAVGRDTIIVFTSDNGTPGAPRRKMPFNVDATCRDQDPARAKLSCYEDGVRVPLVVAVPGATRGYSSDALVHLVDLLPSLAALTGVDVPGGAALDGRSFAPALRGEPAGHEWVYVHNPTSADRALITARWKLLTTPAGEERLFDLREDPGEEQPLAAEGEVAERLRHLRDAVAVSPAQAHDDED